MTKRSLEQIAESLQRKLYEADRDHDGIPDDLEHERLFPGSDWGGTLDNPVHQINPPGPGGGGGRSGSKPQVWRRGGEPVAPPVNKPAPPNVWRKGEAPTKPAEPTIGSQVGKTPKKKLDEPVDLSKEFEKTKPAAKKEKTAAPELSADKRDRMGRKEPSMNQNNEPELRADRRPDRIVEPSDDVKAPGAKGWVGGFVGTAGALGGAGYLYDKYQDEKYKQEQDAAYKAIYGEEPPKPVSREKSSVLEPADPDNPDYAPLKEAKAKPQSTYSKKQYIAWARKYSKLYDVPLSVVLHAMQKETGSYDANTAANVRGPKTKYGQAVGVMQLMPKFFPKLKPEDFVNPEKNIEAGTKELARLYNTYKDPKAALAAYNMGENRDSFREWLKTGNSKLLPKQTREYINGNTKKGTLGYVDDPKVQIAQLDPDTTKDKVARVATDVVSAITGAGSAEAKTSKDAQKVKVPVHPQLKPVESETLVSRLQDLDPEFAGRLKTALDAYGQTLRVTSATRTPLEQAKLYKDWLTGKNPYPTSSELASHKGFAIDVNRADLAKFHQWLQTEKKAGRDYGLETGLEWSGKNRDAVHLQARNWKTIEKQREFDKNQNQDIQVAQNKSKEKTRTVTPNQSAEEKKNKEIEDRLARELAASKQGNKMDGGAAKSAVTPAQAAVKDTSVDTKAHPTGTYVQPDWSKYSYGDLGPLKKDKNGVWKTEDGKQSATDPKLIADLEKLSPVKAPSIVDKAIASLPSFLGGKDASAKTEPSKKEPAVTTKDSESSKDIERGKALDKIIRGVAGDLAGAPAASAEDKRNEYYLQQIEKAKQEKARQDQEKQKKADNNKVSDTKQKKSKNKKVAVSTEREPDSLTIVSDPRLADLPKGGASKATSIKEPEAVSNVAADTGTEKIDVKDLTTDQAGLAAANDTKVDHHAKLIAQKQAEEAQRKQEAERKAAEARAQAEADRLAAQERAQQELEANRQAAIERAKKAAPTSVQQPAAPDTGLGLKNIWDQGITAITGKQRVNLRDPRITLPESINTELQEILRLAGKKTKE